MNKKRSLTGIRATGDLHLGNYLGTIKPCLKNQSNYDCIYFIADLHALTSIKNKAELQQNILIQTATWLALGLDTEKHILFKQSDLPEVLELAWYLGCNTGFGFLEKAHAFKDAIANNKEVNFGVFAYPVLMAADILLYEPDVVPVGQDQKQHVEMARDMAGSLNATYNEKILKLPEVAIQKDVAVIPGLDGRKMSKSYNNGIPIFASEKELRKLVLSIQTDSSDLAASKSMQATTLGQLFKLFTIDSGYQDLELRLNKGGLGWGHAKEELFEKINAELREPRKKYEELIKNTDFLVKVLKNGANKAREVANNVLNRVRQAVGVKF